MIATSLVIDIIDFVDFLFTLLTLTAGGGLV